MPSVHDGERAPGLRFGEPRAQALLVSIAAFCHVMAGLTNAGLCELMRGLFDPGYTTRQATYDLRRLKRKGFIERVPRTHTYRVTAYGRATATALAKIHARVVVPAISDVERALTPPGGATRPIVAAWRRYDSELCKLIDAANIAA